MKAGAMFTTGPRMFGDSMRYLALAARQLFAVTFIIASAGHFTAGTISLAADHGVPLAGILVPISGLIALAGGLSLLFGYHTKLGAGLLVLFLVPVTLTMHDFWAASDPARVQVELILFVRNVLLLCGALFVAYSGAGSLSLDTLMAERHDDLLSDADVELDYVA